MAQRHYFLDLSRWWADVMRNSTVTRISGTPAGTLSFDSGDGTGTGTASVGAHETVTGAETEAFVTGSPAHQPQCVRQIKHAFAQCRNEFDKLQLLHAPASRRACTNA
jgi:hypothetical protein